MTTPRSFSDVLRDSEDPADTVARAIFSGAWFPPPPADPDEPTEDEEV